MYQWGPGDVGTDPTRTKKIPFPCSQQRVDPVPHHLIVFFLKRNTCARPTAIQSDCDASGETQDKRKESSLRSQTEQNATKVAARQGNVSQGANGASSPVPPSWASRGKLP